MRIYFRVEGSWRCLKVLAVYQRCARYATKAFWDTFQGKKRNGLSQSKIEDLTRQMSEWALKVNQLHQKPLERLQIQHNILMGSTQDGFLIAIQCRPCNIKFADLTHKRCEDFNALRLIFLRRGPWNRTFTCKF